MTSFPLYRFLCALALLVGVCAAGLDAAPPADAPLKVHIAQGMWSQHWKLPDALKESCAVSESFLTSRYGFVTALKGFPQTKADLFSHRALIIGNVPTDAYRLEGPWGGMRPAPNGRSVAWVREFVVQGGGVFVLGGNYSFGTGDANFDKEPDAKDFWEILPVKVFKDDLRLTPVGQSVNLEAKKAHPVLRGVDWTGSPVARAYHKVELKQGAEVLVSAGGDPVLILGQYKKGRVAVWTATLHGEPPAGKTAYWRWDGWPVLVRNVTHWLAP